jgi:hypothetical protein
MLETRIFNPPISILTRNFTSECLEISRLLAAAVINPNFCTLLLKNPEQALSVGFQGEDFLFSEEERELILSIRANSLADLASQLAHTFIGHHHVPIYPPVQPTANFRY